MRRLALLAKDSVTEAAKARFAKNFGTDICERCDGLKAGPGVVATCFQKKQCFYDNFRGQASAKQRRVIESLLGDPEKS